MTSSNRSSMLVRVMTKKTQEKKKLMKKTRQSVLTMKWGVPRIMRTCYRTTKRREWMSTKLFRHQKVVERQRREQLNQHLNSQGKARYRMPLSRRGLTVSRFRSQTKTSRRSKLSVRLKTCLSLKSLISRKITIRLISRLSLNRPLKYEIIKSRACLKCSVMEEQDLVLLFCLAVLEKPWRVSQQLPTLKRVYSYSATPILQSNSGVNNFTSLLICRDLLW